MSDDHSFADIVPDEPGLEDTHDEHTAEGEFLPPTAPADQLLDDAPAEGADGALPLVDID